MDPSNEAALVFAKTANGSTVSRIDLMNVFFIVFLCLVVAPGPQGPRAIGFVKGNAPSTPRRKREDKGDKEYRSKFESDANSEIPKRACSLPDPDPTEPRSFDPLQRNATIRPGREVLAECLPGFNPPPFISNPGRASPFRPHRSRRVKAPAKDGVFRPRPRQAAVFGRGKKWSDRIAHLLH